jgi:hypothetical protein
MAKGKKLPKIKVRIITVSDPPETSQTAKPIDSETSLTSKKSDPPTSFFAVADAIVRDLERDARAFGELKAREPFPKERAKELREKIVDGMFQWAIRRMGGDLEKYLEEGRLNFLDLFKLHHLHYDIPDPKMLYNRFWDPFEKTQFFIPLKFPRRAVHHTEWPKLWEAYNNVLSRLMEIPRATRRHGKTYLFALREKLPGPEISDRELAKFVDSSKKLSDIAAVYVSRKFNLTVGSEALKEYFKVFHEASYGYTNFIAKDLLSKVK